MSNRIVEYHKGNLQFSRRDLILLSLLLIVELALLVVEICHLVKIF